MTHTWGYGKDNGPSTWVRNYPIAAGERQSPVNIVTSQAKYDAALQRAPLKIDYSTELEIVLTNNGHSMQTNTTCISEISGGPLRDSYQLAQFHLHWGSGESNQGSEHSVNGHFYPAELHLVHWNCEQYTSFDQAVTKGDGICVIGVFVKVGREHPDFSIVSEHTHYVKHRDSQHRVYQLFEPSSLLPGNIRDYWTYPGSLTTPPLLECVTWILLREPVEFSKKQLDSLRQLNDADGNHILGNYRPPLPLGRRTMRASFT